jgi:hypothetical protein
MRKLKLAVETLHVDSFDVNPPARAGQGTVRGAQQEYQLPPPDDTTGGGGGGSGNIFCISAYPCVPSNEATCGWGTTCANTCWPTCEVTCNC